MLVSVQKNQVCWQGITCPCATITPKQGETTLGRPPGHEDNAPAP